MVFLLCTGWLWVWTSAVEDLREILQWRSRSLSTGGSGNRCSYLPKCKFTLFSSKIPRSVLRSNLRQRLIMFLRENIVVTVVVRKRN